MHNIEVFDVLKSAEYYPDVVTYIGLKFRTLKSLIATSHDHQYVCNLLYLHFRWTLTTVQNLRHIAPVVFL